ncbi:cobalamin biosynthesis protein CobG [Streptomyces sp. NPDC047981]|uniref:cobalamin biosynthesis protein CobG n=1 Tax=Streptomyces sp. NPDC047981 TaxID=3154610 RepID=UPI00342E5CAB
MPPTPPARPNPGEPPVRDRGDACPGALRLHAADDGRLARLRLPAGLLTTHQVLVLASVAEELGDGRVSVTSRGNVELRGLGEACGAALAERLSGAGLLPSETHERVRNIVASPAAGLDGLGHGDVQLWARELDALLCARPWTAALSGRFLFALDDGRGDVAGLGGDVTLIAEGPSVRVRVGGQDVRVGAADAPRAALAAAGAFLAAARTAGNGAWRVRELPEGHAPDLPGALAGAGITAVMAVPAIPALPTVPVLPAVMAVPAVPAVPAVMAVPAVPAEPATAAEPESGGTGAHPKPATAAEPAPGTVTEPLPAMDPPPAGPPAPGPLGDQALHVLAPLGRLTADQLRALAASGGEVRLTPWRGAVVTGLADPGAVAARLRELDAHGLVTDPRSPWAGVGACTGRPGCAKSLADVRADATPGSGHGPGGLPVYFSGCERRCGHPHGAWVDVLATGDGAYLVDGVPTPRTALPDAVAAARVPTATTR